MNKQESLATEVTRPAPTPEQPAAATGAFDFPVVQVGVVGNITVYYDPALGSDGEGLATNFLSLVTAPYEDMETYFGITGGPVSVVIAPLSKSHDGNGGGYHNGGFGVLYIDATFASKVDPLGVEVALYVSELSEQFMNEQNLGWIGHDSNGEGLSKFLASEQRLPGPFPRPIVSGPAWANAGFPDWVSKTEPTDGDLVSAGCAVVYLHWMNLLGFDDAQLALAGGSTLAANYQKLTGKTTAYQDLRAALTGLTVTSDNPFTPVPAAGRWHHKDLTAAASAPPVTINANQPYGYLFPAQGTQHVIYSGDDDHIHELWHNTQGWHHNDLTTAARAPETLGNATGYVFVAQGTQHVVYVGRDDHVHELLDDTNGWHHNDLTALSGATGTSLANPRPCGYMVSAKGMQHVVYRGASDVHIHELWHDTNGWHQRDLCTATGAPAATGDPHGYVFVARGSQHIAYRADDKHIHELQYDSNGWHHTDLNAATSAPAALGDPCGYEFANQRTRHVIYGGIDQHIHELWWDATYGWHHSDLSAATGAPATAGNSPKANGYVFVAEGTQHVVYRGSDQHIHELRWDTHGWRHNDLSAATGAPAAADLSDPHGYTFPAKGTQHVVYAGSDGHIHELWWG